MHSERFKSTSLPMLILLIQLTVFFANSAVISFKIGEVEKTGVFRVNADQVVVKHDMDGSILFTSAEQVQELGLAGDPGIPWKVYDILLPPDVEAGSIRCTAENLIYAGVESGDVLPILPPATWDEALNREILCWPDEKSIVNGRNLSVYASNTFWPSEPAQVVHVGEMAQYKIVKIAVALVKLNPVKKEVARLINAEISVKFKTQGNKAPSVFHSRGNDIARVKDVTINWSQYLDTYGNGNRSVLINAPNGYTIITTAAIKNSLKEFDNFVNYKKLQGYTVEVILESEWGGGTGNAASENIRKWLQNNYQTKNILYVLLIGNPNPKTGDVPMKLCYETPSAGNEAPTDMYYSNLTGNWDLNKDGFFGTKNDIGAGGVSLFWQVLVGRIPFYGATDATVTDKILARTITYEKASDVKWRWNMLLPWVPMDAQTPNYFCPEQFRTNFLIPFKMTSYRIYNDSYGLTPLPEAFPGSVTKTAQVWKDGKFGFVFWGTHGNGTSGSNVMNSTTARTLTDMYPSNTWQYSCSTAEPENTDNLAYALLKSACITTSGATRSGWYLPGEKDYSKTTSEPGMGYQNMKRVVGTPNISVAKAWQDARQEMVPGMWDNFILHNVYGDPSTVVYPTSTGIQKTEQRQPSLSGLRYCNSQIVYQVSHKAPVTITLYDMHGKLTQVLVNEIKCPGSYTFTISHNKNIAAAGVYIAKIKVADFTQAIKVAIQ